MTTGKMFGRLKALKKSVLADGRVDWGEPNRLLAAIRHLAEKIVRRASDPDLFVPIEIKLAASK